MNKGIDRARGEWLYFLGADDVLLNNSVLSKISNEISTGSKLLFGRVVFEISNRKNFKSKPKISKLSNLLWIKNTVHHQGVFYNSDLFSKFRYDESYSVLADYKLHLKLYMEETAVTVSNVDVAFCGGNGISKKFNWNLYREDIRLKTESSCVLLYPFYWIVGVMKYFLKSIKGVFASK